MKSKSHRRNMKNKTTLHLELINQILLRLPVKSLVHFRCVCKSWCSLISDDPHFAKSHFELAAAPTRRLMFITSSAPETRSIDLDAPLKDDSASATVKLDFLLPQSYFHLRIGGSCRGFLFLERHPNLYLWNPSTGFHKQIPSAPFGNRMPYLYGFGNDPTTDDYLVVLGYPDLASPDYPTHFVFFSLKANTWKEIEGLPYVHASRVPRVGSLLNGAIHWLACRHGISVNVIVAFDLMERRLSEIPLPVPGDFDLDVNCDLWVLGGFFSLWVMGNGTVDIWVMEEHSGHSSWTKTLVLAIDHIPTPAQYFFSLIYICSTECGDIVGTNGSIGLVKY